MKVYIAKIHKFNNGRVQCEGFRYLKNQNPKNKYDQYIGQYMNITLPLEDYKQVIAASKGQLPLVADIKLVKGVGAVLNRE